MTMLWENRTRAAKTAGRRSVPAVLYDCCCFVLSAVLLDFGGDTKQTNGSPRLPQVQYLSLRWFCSGEPAITETGSRASAGAGFVSSASRLQRENGHLPFSSAQTQSSIFSVQKEPSRSLTNALLIRCILLAKKLRHCVLRKEITAQLILAAENPLRQGCFSVIFCVLCANFRFFVRASNRKHLFQKQRTILVNSLQLDA